MPAEFIINEPTIQTIGSDVVRDAMRITYRALPSGVVYSLLFAPVEIWDAGAIQQQADLWASNWNANSLVPGVVGISVTQIVDQAGNLQDVAQVTVSSTSGNSSSLLNVYPINWSPSIEGTTLTKSFGDVIRAEVARLDSIEAAGSTTRAPTTTAPSPAA